MISKWTVNVQFDTERGIVYITTARDFLRTDVVSRV